MKDGNANPNKEKTMENVAFFFVYSRANGKNGRPFRLIVVYAYGELGLEVAYVAEARSTNPNHVEFLKNSGILCVSEPKVTVSQYNAVKRANQHILQVTD